MPASRTRPSRRLLRMAAIMIPVAPAIRREETFSNGSVGRSDKGAAESAAEALAMTRVLYPIRRLAFGVRRSAFGVKAANEGSGMPYNSYSLRNNGDGGEYFMDWG